MILLWAVAGLALLLAVVTYLIGRRTARKLEHLTEMYWQLKFEHGELRARVEPPAPPSSQVQTTFVPLAQLTGRSGDEPRPSTTADGGGSGGNP